MLSAEEVDSVDGSTGNNSGEKGMDHTINTIAGVLGNVLEWYDFALYGFFSDVISEVFFPPKAPDEQSRDLIRSFIIFAAAFIARPLGGLGVGYLGDKFGRKIALTRSMFLMSFPTFLMALIPSYATIGWLSTVLLLLCRILQGLSVGGQLPASLVYTVELAPREKWGLYATFPLIASTLGTLLGNSVGAFLRTFLTHEQLVDYGWRFPFAFGILIVIAAGYLRVYGDDVRPNVGAFDRDTSPFTSPVRLTCCQPENCYAMFLASLGCMVYAVGFYLTYIWMPIYMGFLLDPPIPNSYWINECSLIRLMLFIPFAGLFSDRVGHLKCLVYGTIGVMLWGPLTVVVMGTSGRNNVIIGFISSLLTQWILSIAIAFVSGPLWAWLFDCLDSKVRLTSACLGYDIAMATLGGFSPAIATALFEYAGPFTASILYVIGGAMSLVGMYFMNKHVVHSRSLESNSEISEEKLDIIRYIHLPEVS